MRTSDINQLIQTVIKGGKVRTGMDIFDKNGFKVISKDASVDHVQPLLMLKVNGITTVQFDSGAGGDIWDETGKSVFDRVTRNDSPEKGNQATSIKAVLTRMEDACLRFMDQYKWFQPFFREMVEGIKANKGKMDLDKRLPSIEKMVHFLLNHDPSFTFLNRNPLTADNYLLSHAINVCNIGAAVLKRFNKNFSHIINQHLSARFAERLDLEANFHRDVFIYYVPEAIAEIATGYFLHDIGKALIPDAILNKQSALSDRERRVMQSHSYKEGVDVLDINHIDSLYIQTVVKWHHVAIYTDEPNSYPEGILPIEIPPYVKICKIVDIYDAMSSRRTYGEATDPSNVMAQVFRKYEGKDPMLQYILHAFIREMGVCPTGSVINLRNGQLAFVLDKSGPIVLPLTDKTGAPLKRHADPVDLGEKQKTDSVFEIDRRKPPLPPDQVFDILPPEIHKLFARISPVGELK